MRGLALEGERPAHKSALIRRPSPDQNYPPIPTSPNRGRRMRIRASTCRPRGWSRLRSPPKVRHLWAFGDVCGSGMPAEAALAPHFQTPAPCFLLHPLHFFLPTIGSSAAGGLTLVWQTGPGSVTRSRVMESGRCWRTGDQNTAVPLPHPTLPGGDCAQNPGRAGVSGPKRSRQGKQGVRACFCPVPTSADC